MVNNILLPGEGRSLVHDVQVGAREAGDHRGALRPPTPTVCYRTAGLRSRAQVNNARDISEQSSEIAAGRPADDGWRRVLPHASATG